jgi:hypothetical protein
MESLWKRGCKSLILAMIHMNLAVFAPGVQKSIDTDGWVL